MVRQRGTFQNKMTRRGEKSLQESQVFLTDVTAHLRRVKSVFHTRELIQHQDQPELVLISGWDGAVRERLPGATAVPSLIHTDLFHPRAVQGPTQVSCIGWLWN